jgi:hypothetical protein
MIRSLWHWRWAIAVLGLAAVGFLGCGDNLDPTTVDPPEDEIVECAGILSIEWCGGATDDFLCTDATGAPVSGCQMPGDHRRLCVEECGL